LVYPERLRELHFWVDLYVLKQFTYPVLLVFKDKIFFCKKVKKNVRVITLFFGQFYLHAYVNTDGDLNAQKPMECILNWVACA